MARRQIAFEILNFTANCPRINPTVFAPAIRSISSIRSISTHRFSSHPSSSLNFKPRPTPHLQYPTCAATEMHTEARTALSELLADQLEKPLLDDRSYRVIKLQNQLEALLIHDPDTDKASAAVDVRAGSLSDANDLPGMAHAVEHMLFLGNEKYPSENDYTAYLAQYAGSHNAFTSQISTNYFFEMSVADNNKTENKTPSAEKTTTPFYGALDRFAQFFIKPLFLEDSLDRELRAVDSENKKNLQSDIWRLQQLRRSLSNPAHPSSNFSTGNLKTLRDDPVARGVDIRKAFISFHDEQYSANRMKLVILGRESLDELQQWTEELFSSVPDKNLKPNHWEMPVLTEKELLTEIFAKPVMEMRELTLTFPYPDEEELWDSQPGRYISHLVGHEGPGSILADIKAKGWASSLSAGSRTICKGSGQFEIRVSVTPEGLKNYQHIVKTVFEYMSILHQTPPQKWIFEESRDLAEVEFRFQQKRSASSTASSMAGIMQQPVPRQQLLSGLLTTRKYDPDAITRGIKALNVNNFRLMIVSKELLPGEIRTEKWYGTEYTIRKISEDFMSAVKNAASVTPEERSENLYLPGKNEFVPTKLDVDKKEVETPAPRPTLVRNDERVRLWHKKDDKWWVPKATYYLRMRNPVLGLSARNSIMTSLYSGLVDDALSDYTYDAELAGLEFGFYGTLTSLSCSVSGYNDKMSVLLEKALTTARSLEIKDDRFEIIKERIERQLRNRGYSTPYGQVGEYSRWLTTEGGFIADQYLEELATITAQDIRNFQPLMWGQLHIEALAHGNLYLEDALKLTNLTEKIVNTRTLPPSQFRSPRAFVLPEGSNYIYSRMLPDPMNINHAIEYVLQTSEITDRSLRAQILLLDQMVHEPAFDRLRTKEQLGYVVFSGAIRSTTMLAFRFIIQSERDCEYLETRIDAFLRAFKSELREMSSEKFEGHRRSKINERLEKIKNLSKETDLYMTHMGNEMYHFEEAQDDAADLAKVTKEEMIEFFDRHIDPDSPHRKKVSVFLRAKKSPEDLANIMTSQQQQAGFASLLSQFLAAIGAVENPEKIEEKFASVNIANGEQESILRALQSYLAEDAALESEKVSAAMQQAKVMMSQMLAQLGITAGADCKAETVEKVAAPAIAPVVIEDVHAWKAGMPLSAGARPVRPLSEYEKDPVCKL